MGHNNLTNNINISTNYIMRPKQKLGRKQRNKDICCELRTNSSRCNVLMDFKREST